MKNFLALIFIMYLSLLSTASASTIKWFNSTSPFERASNEFHLEWGLESDKTGAKLKIDCEKGSAHFVDRGSLRVYNCGDSLFFNPGQDVYAFAMTANALQSWANAKFTLVTENDEKSFEMGFKGVAKFNRDLYFGMGDDLDVRMLQEFLTEAGFYKGPITGNFFEQTREAVKRFQRKNGVKDTGYVGPTTRSVLNRK